MKTSHTNKDTFNLIGIKKQLYKVGSKCRHHTVNFVNLKKWKLLHVLLALAICKYNFIECCYNRKWNSSYMFKKWAFLETYNISMQNSSKQEKKSCYGNL